MHAKCSMKFFNEMSRRKEAATDEATSSRGRVSRNSNRGRQDTFTNERFDHQLHFNRWKGMENRDIVHERIICLDGEEETSFCNRIQGLGDLCMRTWSASMCPCCVNFAPISPRQSRTMCSSEGRRSLSPRLMSVAT
ncbi:hypothetical protein PIB30_042405 [Stylosanthes scabra]|uniref:Uncharacterized protein n=1 Tax=Stylosanthes scabra TaxID=79078 RepID=A0ABU6YE07_9FABA|nr:hypothetical protein [Stylosanthes scabra]